MGEYIFINLSLKSTSSLRIRLHVRKINRNTDSNIIFPGGRFLGMLAKRNKKDLWRHMVTFLQDPLNDDQLAYDLVRLV